MKALLRLVLLGVVLLEVGCGLPDTFFLQAPAPGTVVPGVSFSFTNPIHDLNHDINVTFLGDELYYKFYADQNVENNAYDQSNPQDASVQLMAKGFSQVCLFTDQNGSLSDPLIPPTGTSVIIKIQPTNPDSTQTNYAIDGGIPVEIRRYAIDINGVSLKTFQDNLRVPTNYQSGDRDVGTSLYLLMGGTGQIYIAMYAISYGQIVGVKTPARSAAVFLGSLNFGFTP